MARILVCGTLAYDIIGRCDTPLGASPHNVKLERIDEGFGGCAMNIAYSLKGLGHEPVPLVYVGDDYEPGYSTHVRRQGITEVGIVREPGARSPRGIVLTGSDGAQFTAFYPGPSGLDRVATDVRRLTGARGFDAAIFATDLPAKTLACANALADVPLRVWCPGQYAEHWSAELLHALIDRVDLVVVNRDEWQSLRARLPGPLQPARPIRLVVTQGPRPVLAIPDGLRVPVPAVDPARQIDPTGCGDAFVAALTAVLTEGLPLGDAVRAGIALARRCLGQLGAQRH